MVRKLKSRSRDEQKAAWANINEKNFYASAVEDSKVEKYTPKRKTKRKTAADYGDDPKIRRSHGEHTQTSDQPWEQAYKRKKLREARLKKKPKKVKGKKPSAKPKRKAVEKVSVKKRKPKEEEYKKFKTDEGKPLFKNKEQFEQWKKTQEFNAENEREREENYKEKYGEYREDFYMNYHRVENGKLKRQPLSMPTKEERKARVNTITMAMQAEKHDKEEIKREYGIEPTEKDWIYYKRHHTIPEKSKKRDFESKKAYETWNEMLHSSLKAREEEKKHLRRHPDDKNTKESIKLLDENIKYYNSQKMKAEKEMKAHQSKSREPSAAHEG